MTASLSFPRVGDKQNSSQFEDYLGQLLDERDRIGLTEAIRQIDALMITVEPSHSVAYVAELCVMTPYHYLVTLETEAHYTHILRIDMSAPDILVREVKDPNVRGIFRSLNEVYPIGAVKPNSRYMGEVLRVTDPHAVVDMQKARDIRFFNQEQIRKLELPGNMAVVKPSPYTHNIVAYWERPESDIRVYALGWSSIRDDMQAAYEAAKATQKRLGIDELLLPIDHLATRIYSQNREAAILEYLTLSSYYFWGAYDIADQNSSTNVTKSVHYTNELECPAKVFTAANHPYFMNHLLTESPTEAFVRNFGPRLHHIAVAVKDGETAAARQHRLRRQFAARLRPELSARRHRLEGSGPEADLLQRVGIFLADRRIRPALRRIPGVFHQGQRRRTHPRRRRGGKSQGLAGSRAGLIHTI